MGEFEDYDPEEEREYWRNKFRREREGVWPPEDAVDYPKEEPLKPLSYWSRVVREANYAHTQGLAHETSYCQYCKSESAYDAVRQYTESGTQATAAMTNNTYTTTEEQVTSIAERKEALQRQAEQLLLRMDALSKIPNENPFADGDVFRLTKKWSGPGKTYVYAVVFIHDTFYTTGTRSDTRVFASWDDFIAWAGEAAVKIEKAVAWENVVE